jgi:hypothetical protein
MARKGPRLRAWKIWRNGAPIEPERGGHWVRDYLSTARHPFPRMAHQGAARDVEPALLAPRQAGEEFKVIHSGPAMLAAITGPDGHFIGVHRTWLDLTRPNGKAAIPDPAGDDTLDAKKVEGSQKGGKIVLRDGADALCLALGEGIETVLSWNEMQASASREWLVKPALWVGINIGNIAGKAAEMIPHPSLMLTDTLGRSGGRRSAAMSRTCPTATACRSRPMISSA